MNAEFTHAQLRKRIKNSYEMIVVARLRLLLKNKTGDALYERRLLNNFKN
jgi:hypothetical protein